MSDQASVQLSFEVGGGLPSKMVLTVSGRPFAHRELLKGEEIHLQIVGADGKTVADGYGRVIGVAFKDKVDKDTGEVVETERIHSIKVS